MPIEDKVEETAQERLRRAAEDAPSDAGDVEGYRHPGFRWLDRSECKDIGLSEYFAQAGHVLSDEPKQACLRCPVWRECTIFAYLGNPDGKLITGGYFAALSPGQRKKMTLGEALAYGEQLRAGQGTNAQ